MKLIFSLEIASDEIQDLIFRIRPYLKAKQILFLEGDLGAGKTTFVRHLLESYGYHLANSPTYAFRQTYELNSLETSKKNQSNFSKIEHIDLYRTTNDEDIESIGLWDMFSDENILALIEWGSRVPSSDWPMGWSQYLLKISNLDEKRKYELYSC